jgi:cytidine deaminase
MTDKELIQIAAEAMENAYASYSGYKVGAALLCADGTIYTGCNVENSSFGATICAERGALSKAVCDGKRDFLQIAIISTGEDYCVPCGICRQVLWEFSDDLEILCAKSSGGYRSYRIKERLPHGFKLENSK